MPLQDLLSFAFWIAGFFGNTIVWRGHRYYLHADGRFAPVIPVAESQGEYSVVKDLLSLK
jgi:hypothetical protein